MFMAVVAFSAVAAGTTAPADGDRPRSVIALVGCSRIVEESLRVRCYDREVAALDEAERDHKIVILDHEEVQKTRRTLFGLNLPSLKLFGEHGAGKSKDRRSADEELTALDTVVSTITRGNDGQVIFTVENGSRWAQSDERTISLARIRSGTKVHISRGAMGSFFAGFDHSTTIRVRRIN